VPPTKNFMHWASKDADLTVPQEETRGLSRGDTCAPNEPKASILKGHLGARSKPNGPSGQDTGMFIKGVGMSTISGG
jgi:hypothetical protein